ncbi:Metallopeptidase family M24 [Polystyrenella longa]|uniref:Metallopeptidase family M24 n=1 Tax=Polystyrenella longa TaxID=2528007 RepID=A0A518CS13_9PLAN|nr:aminopeptidase P family protein [Polystyrenella longa]QDU82003.1 Metallopeptidase family M24 [Polystyrenella longa]
MSFVTHRYSLPVSSAEISTIDPQRLLEVDEKHKKLIEFLESHQLDALLLQKPENLSWFTAGGDFARMGSSETAGSIFVTPAARLLATNSIDAARIFDREIPGFGFQVKERPWHESPETLIEDLCRSRRVASDTGQHSTKDVSLHLKNLRVSLTERDCGLLRELGRDISHAVEATARNLQRGQTEAEIAAQLAHRLIKRNIVPDRIQVLADGQSQRYPSWSYGDDRVERYCIISAVGRRNGLHVGASRTVSFGALPRTVRDAHFRVMLVQATGMHFSQPDWEMFEIWNRIQRIYEKFGHPLEWRRAEQASVMGYKASEVPLVPNSQFRLEENMVLHWHPSIGAAMVGDSILVAEGGFELLTPLDEWPKIKIEVKGLPIYRPDILQRPE